jgi:hypothetical protein
VASRQKKKERRNIAHCVPQPVVEHEEAEDGIVKLLVPRFRARWMHWLQKRLKNPHMRVRLDDIGSAVWKLIDGRRTVTEIGIVMSEQFGEKIEPVEHRLGVFFGMLRRNNLVEWDESQVVVHFPEDTNPVEPR